MLPERVEHEALLPHLFDNYLLATELFDVLADPDYDLDAPLGSAERGSEERTGRGEVLMVQGHNSYHCMCVERLQVNEFSARSTVRTMTDGTKTQHLESS